MYSYKRFNYNYMEIVGYETHERIYNNKDIQDITGQDYW